MLSGHAVCPTVWLNEIDGGVTVRIAPVGGGGVVELHVTCSVALPLPPLLVLVAVIVAVPAPTHVTRPLLASTVATPVFDELYTVVPRSVDPLLPNGSTVANR